MHPAICVCVVVLCIVQCTHLINSMLCTKSNVEANGLRKRVNVRHGQINPAGGGGGGLLLRYTHYGQFPSCACLAYRQLTCYSSCNSPVNDQFFLGKLIIIIINNLFAKKFSLQFYI